MIQEPNFWNGAALGSAGLAVFAKEACGGTVCCFHYGFEIILGQEKRKVPKVCLLGNNMSQDHPRSREVKVVRSATLLAIINVLFQKDR